jgi:hypothetical protein
MDRPIIFSAPMVLALLEGRKTMTRRLATSPLRKVIPGDRLYVRESGVWYIENIKGVGECPWAHYRATDEDAFLPGMKWRPSIHMPRWASRLTLIVTATKIERLSSMSTADERAEGFDNDGLAFCELWDALHGPGSYDANPEVVAISFRVVLANIDTPEARAA